MKKKIKLLIILFIFLLLGGCGEKKEYQIIDISASELISNMREGKTLIVFSYYDHSLKSEQMQKDLQRIADSLQSDIYHLDQYHIDTDGGSILTNEFNTAIQDNYFSVYVGTEEKLHDNYTSIKQALEVLNDYQSSKDIKLQDSSENKKHLEEAKQYFNEGNIYKANELLSKAWSSKEVRDYYNDNKEFLILHAWERYKSLYNSADHFIYTSINTFTGSSSYLKKTVKSNSAEFEKPDYYDFDSKFYYLVKDKKIFIGKDEDNLKEKYTIKYLDYDRLVIEDIENKEKIEYIRRDL